jgi:hypothetical protein
MSIPGLIDDLVHWWGQPMWASLECMTTTHHNHRIHPPSDRETDAQATGLEKFIKDIHRIGPAPTRRREALVAGFTIILLALVIGIMAPGVVFSSIAVVVALAAIAIRWAVGSRAWGQR